jgi:hypothetical protein
MHAPVTPPDKDSCCRRWLDQLERHGPFHNATELRACRCGRRFYVQFACMAVFGAWRCNVVDALPMAPSRPAPERS